MYIYIYIYYLLYVCFRMHARECVGASTFIYSRPDKD